MLKDDDRFSLYCLSAAGLVFVNKLQQVKTAKKHRLAFSILA